MPQLLGAELHIDLSEVLSTLITYPYNIISGAAAVGTVLLLLRRCDNILYFDNGWAPPTKCNWN